MFIERSITGKLSTLASQFPMVFLIGPKQGGKSTLLQNTFLNYRYFSFEDKDTLEEATSDPRCFLDKYDEYVIFDEAQRCPELFSYLPEIINSRNLPGQFIFSSSHNFSSMKKISQLLAERVAVLHLLPLSWKELTDTTIAPSVSKFVFIGGYPQIYASDFFPTDFFDSYLQAYIEKDIHREYGIRKMTDFRSFLILCATRIGSVLNINSLAKDARISVTTAKEWLSLLESSFVIFRLSPYYRNYGKRIIRSPKLYFYDSGLAAFLLGLETETEVTSSQYYESLFENVVISDVLKQYTAKGQTPEIFYWRDSNQNEIDLIIEKDTNPHLLIEIKSSATYRSDFFNSIDKLGEQMQVEKERRLVVYGGPASGIPKRLLTLNNLYTII